MNAQENREQHTFSTMVPSGLTVLPEVSRNPEALFFRLFERQMVKDGGMFLVSTPTMKLSLLQEMARNRKLTLSPEILQSMSFRSVMESSQRIRLEEYEKAVVTKLAGDPKPQHLFVNVVQQVSHAGAQALVFAFITICFHFVASFLGFFKKDFLVEK